ncbi:hypothetical protein R69619_01913 [Paraburkholderia nemoris]|uniref:hypothetical protein n=1 Tax=Paraburkholderia nemoris TaxID=2793076 RepID=UPI00190AEDBF|nr:hypothetical protein [Paraburkholderia nemoris]MBK3740878.1 hypothetical protein [Paraburkholderia aspalathi]CAE6728718.1 hypothetical protein R69619_01913 [Paraburkholderia nemoris]
MAIKIKFLGVGRSVRALCLMMTLTILTQRFAIPLGATQLPVAFLLYWATVLWLAVDGLTVPRKLNAIVLWVSFGLILLCSLSTYGKTSISSLLYLLALYLPLTMGATRSVTRENTREAARYFVLLMVFFSIVGIWQYFSQLILHIAYIDPIGNLPDAVVMQGYLASYPVSYGGDLYKSNAFVFLEASFLSQFIALAIIIELNLLRRLWVLLTLLLGLLVTFSGTGLMLLVVVAPFILIKNIRSLKVIALTVAAIVVLVGTVIARPEVMVRVAEFGASDTSASARFIEPFTRMARYSTRNASSLIAGYGAGSSDRLGNTSDSLVNYSAIPKAIIEYGLLGGVPLLLAIATCITLSVGALPLVAALVVTHFVLSGALLQPISVMLIYFFNVSTVRKRRPARRDLAASI